jgi:hypothetical protein
VHALLVPELALNRHKVPPVTLTRIDPRLLFTTPTVAAAAPLEVFGVAAVAAPPPPQAATVRAERYRRCAGEEDDGFAASHVAPSVWEVDSRSDGR